MYYAQNIIENLPRTRDGELLVPWQTYYTKDGHPIRVKYVLVFDATVLTEDGLGFRTCTEWGVFAKNPKDKYS